MFYHNTKYRFALPGQIQSLSGGIIAASAMPAPQLTRRDWRKYKYLEHRLFDPQLYLAGLDARRAQETVVKLATYPWFGVLHPEYDSGKHKSLLAYKKLVSEELSSSWPRNAPTGADQIAAAQAAIGFQVDMECDAIVLPAPLVTTEKDVDTWVRWIDAGIHAARRLDVTMPLLGTVAVSDVLFPNTDPTRNAVIRAIVAHSKARSELAGSYVVLESRLADEYSISSEDTAAALISLVSRLSLSRRRLVAVNYCGSFGLALVAAGASVWASGYYRSQRRLRLEDFNLSGGAAFPRYCSLRLLGDVGVDRDIALLSKSGEFPLERWFSEPARPLVAAVRRGQSIDSVPEWRYVRQNITAAAEHYLSTMDRLGRYLHSRTADERIETVDQWLTRAVGVARKVEASGVSQSTETRHQLAWQSAFSAWRARREG